MLYEFNTKGFVRPESIVADLDALISQAPTADHMRSLWEQAETYTDAELVDGVWLTADDCLG